jgi:hypothetical protein
MEVQVRKPEHELDLKDKLPHLYKFSDGPFKSCDEFILHFHEVKSETPSARTGEKLVLRWATGSGKLP